MPRQAFMEHETRAGIRTVAVAGNPNSGKTTVFNGLTRLRQRVGNYPGVTVEKKVGKMIFPGNHAVDVIDLPGIYSLTVRSADEQIARDVLLGREPDTPEPDAVICVIDAGNIERNLYLAVQILDMGLPVILALNMMDEVERQRKSIDTRKLSELLGIPVVPLVATRGKGFDELKRLIIEGFPMTYKRQWSMAPALEEEIDKIVELLISRAGMSRPAAFHEALMLMTGGFQTGTSPDHNWQWRDDIYADIQTVFRRIRGFGLQGCSSAIEARYDWIKYIVSQTVSAEGAKQTRWTERFDAILTQKILGPLFFFGVMGFMFYLIFFIAAYPMDWIDAGFTALSGQVAAWLPDMIFRGLITDGIIAGVGGVIIFLPQILILFFFIGLLQDTGYMARAAFMIDRLMNQVGLQGKAFIPLLSSFACAIPGIMSARTIENPKDRLVTILIAPLMSCSARLPVYTILIAVLLPETSAWKKAGLMLIMYMFGIIGACLMAWIFKRTFFRRHRPVFMLELPPYRWPSLKSILIQIWERSRIFLKRAGTIILLMSILLWGLMTFPQSPDLPPNEALKQTYAGQLGHMIEPVIKPLGYDWRVGIGLIGSFAAREVFISTMSIVFNLDEEASGLSLREAFAQARWPDGRPLFTPLVCLSLMIFFVFALQCMSTVAVVARETNGWKWPAFQLAYMTALAYCAALIVYQGGRLLGFV